MKGSYFFIQDMSANIPPFSLVNPAFLIKVVLTFVYNFILLKISKNANIMIEYI